jgi:hypothetical protein
MNQHELIMVEVMPSFPVTIVDQLSKNVGVFRIAEMIYVSIVFKNTRMAKQHLFQI